MREKDALHLVGTPVTETTAYGALKEAGLADWNVRKQTMRTSGNAKVTDRWAVVRDNPLTGELEYMNTCGGRYQIWQNEEHADFLDHLVFEAQGSYEVAKSFRNGKVVYLSIKLPNQLTVAGDDPVNLYINGINSFDGTTPFTVSLDPVRAWCANQLNYFRSKQHRVFRMRHSGDMTGKVQLAREALGLLLTGVQDFQKDAEELARVNLTDARFEAIVDKLLPRPEERNSEAYEVSRAKLTSLYRNSDTTANIRGSAWGGYNAFTEYLDWYRPLKGGETDEKRATRIMLDTKAVEKKSQAFAAFSLANG